MSKQKNDRRLHERIAIDIAGFGLIIIAPFLGWLPGPGGIPLFLAGLGLISLNHEWAENLLKNFEKKREQFTDKVLLASPVISRSIDLICLIAFAGGIYIVNTQDSIIIRGTSLGLISVSLLIMASNQKRFERCVSWFKRRKKSKTR